MSCEKVDIGWLNESELSGGPTLHKICTKRHPTTLAPSAVDRVLLSTSPGRKLTGAKHRDPFLRLLCLQRFEH